MATKLGIYQSAMILLGQRHFESVTQRRPERFVLDAEYDNVVAECLAGGIWNFALRDASEAQDGAGSFGHTFVFNKPSDLVHLYTLSITADHATPLVDGFIDQASTWHASTSPIYIRYTSNNASFGGDLTKWPPAFTRYVEASLAAVCALRITRGNADAARMAFDLQAYRYQVALDICALTALPGMKPFNVEARNPANADVPHGSERVLPFGRMPPASSKGEER